MKSDSLQRAKLICGEKDLLSDYFLDLLKEYGIDIENGLKLQEEFLDIAGSYYFYHVDNLFKKLFLKYYRLQYPNGSKLNEDNLDDLIPTFLLDAKTIKRRANIDVMVYKLGEFTKSEIFSSILNENGIEKYRKRMIDDWTHDIYGEIVTEGNFEDYFTNLVEKYVEIDNSDWYKSLDELMDDIVNNTNEELISAALNRSMWEFTIDCHFGLGTYIRNSISSNPHKYWIEDDCRELYKKDLNDENLEDKPTFPPDLFFLDEMSRYILEKIWIKLNELYNNV